MCEQPCQCAEVGDHPRRRFLSWGAAILAAIPAVIFVWPLLASLIGPMYRKRKLQYSKVTGFGSASLGQPVKLSFPFLQVDAYLRQEVTHDVWVVKHSPTEATVFSPICPHLGCRYDYDAQKQLFICPCHGSVFTIAGKVIAGPSPRPLDTLPHKIRDGQLMVEWERFKVGIAEKVRV